MENLKIGLIAEGGDPLNGFSVCLSSFHKAANHVHTDLFLFLNNVFFAVYWRKLFCCCCGCACCKQGFNNISIKASYETYSSYILLAMHAREKWCPLFIQFLVPDKGGKRTYEFTPVRLFVHSSGFFRKNHLLECS